MTRRLLAPIALLCLTAAALTPVAADEKLAGIACRSVHLGYPAPESEWFTTTMTVTHSAPGTYFMAAGWSGGYFGIQEKDKGVKCVIFSVWDPTAGDDPKKVPDEKRVKLIHKDKDVRVGRFGGEGTGGQSFLDLNWEIGKPYRFLVRAKHDAGRTEYAGYLGLPGSKEWRHLVTFSTPSKAKGLRGLYSFVEDFKRNKVSLTKARRATFSDGWAREADGRWHSLTRAVFTADGNPATNIDAGSEGGTFYLATGGETKNSGAKLRAKIDREPDGVALPK